MKDIAKLLGITLVLFVCCIAKSQSKYTTNGIVHTCSSGQYVTTDPFSVGAGNYLIKNSSFSDGDHVMCELTRYQLPSIDGDIYLYELTNIQDEN